MGIRKLLGCGRCGCLQVPSVPSARFARASSELRRQATLPVAQKEEADPVALRKLVPALPAEDCVDRVRISPPSLRVVALVVLAAVRWRRPVLRKLGHSVPGTGQQNAAWCFEGLAQGFLDGKGAEDAKDEDATAEKVREILRLLESDQSLAHVSDFAKAYGDEAFCRRLLRKHSGSLKKSMAKFRKAILWREAHCQLIATRTFAQAGDNRVMGHDLEGHPLLYTCMKNQILPGSQGLDQLVVKTLEAIDLMPPGVEKATHVWDLHGMKLHLNLSPAPLLHMVESSEDYFAERMHKLVIVDTSHAGMLLKDAVWPFVPAQTKEKVLFVTAAGAEAYFQAICTPALAASLSFAMEQNRELGVSYEERSRTWMQLSRDGTYVPAFK